jgi:hypothetical protein
VKGALLYHTPAITSGGLSHLVLGHSSPGSLVTHCLSRRGHVSPRAPAQAPPLALLFRNPPTRALARSDERDTCLRPRPGGRDPRHATRGPRPVAHAPRLPPLLARRRLLSVLYWPVLPSGRRACLPFPSTRLPGSGRLDCFPRSGLSSPVPVTQPFPARPPFRACWSLACSVVGLANEGGGACSEEASPCVPCSGAHHGESSAAAPAHGHACARLL